MPRKIKLYTATWRARGRARPPRARARALARYDPQLIKPPSDYRGADSVRMFVLGQVLVIGQ